MTSNTNRLDGAMMTDEQIAAFEGLPVEQAKFYFDRRNADGRTHREMVVALLSASKPAALEGWKLVPVAPTQAMLIRGVIAADSDINSDRAAQVYAAMTADEIKCNRCFGKGVIPVGLHNEECPDCEGRVYAAAPAAPAQSMEAVATVVVNKQGDPIRGISFLSLNEHGRATLPAGKHDLYTAPQSTQTAIGRAASPQAAAMQTAQSRVLTLDDIRGKAVDQGFQYWNASDDHGVVATIAQAIELLQDLLKIQVEIKPATGDQ